MILPFSSQKFPDIAEMSGKGQRSRVKRVYLSVILLCAVVNSGFSQEVKPDFVQTLAEFKYSLYADLAPIPVENFDILSFNNNDKIVEKIATFISDNKAGIIAVFNTIKSSN